MIEHFVDIATSDGEMNSFIVHPEENGPHPVVIYLMDAPGMREESRDCCRRLASAGYYVIASNLYYRQVREFNVFELEGTREDQLTYMNSLTNSLIVDDVGSMIDFADTDAAADASRIGIVGYCMSGPFAIVAAARYDDRVKATASFHGVKLATDADDSPHRMVQSFTGEVYVGAAELDQIIPVEQVNAFEAALEASPATGRVEWYLGCDHAFVFPARPVYDKAGSERHWERLHALFDRNLRQS